MMGGSGKCESNSFCVTGSVAEVYTARFLTVSECFIGVLSRVRRFSLFSEKVAC